MKNSKRVASGGCLCGAVRYQVQGPLREVVACHCRQCQKTSGHFVAATEAERQHFRLVEERGLAWYRSSDFAERGFCRVCGGNLFWRRFDGNTVAITAGTLDRPTGLRLVEHIFTETAGDYYQITDGLPQRPQGRDSTPGGD